MPRQSSRTVTYPDLLALAEEVLEQREGWLNGARQRGISNLEPLTHKVEAARMLVKMLRKGVKEKQTDFYQLFEQVKK
jgi:hypothetical protein